MEHLNIQKSLVMSSSISMPLTSRSGRMEMVASRRGAGPNPVDQSQGQGQGWV